MPMINEKSRVWIAVLAGLVASLLLIWATPSHPYKPRGVLLPAKVVRPASSVDQIQFYPVANAPSSYQTLGTIHIQLHYPESTQIAEKEILSYARQLAAKVGANGVIINRFVHSGKKSALSIYFFVGTAIYHDSGQTSLRRMRVHPLYLYGGAS